jgi:hypothetical protein
MLIGEVDERCTRICTRPARAWGAPLMACAYVSGRGPADDVVIWTPAPTIQAVQTRKINCDHSWKS